MNAWFAITPLKFDRKKRDEEVTSVRHPVRSFASSLSFCWEAKKRPRRSVTQRIFSGQLVLGRRSVGPRLLSSSAAEMSGLAELMRESPAYKKAVLAVAVTAGVGACAYYGYRCATRHCKGAPGPTSRGSAKVPAY